MARFNRITTTGDADHVMVALRRLARARYLGEVAGDDQVELADTDPAMARLTTEQRRWVRDTNAGRLNLHGTLNSSVVERWGPIGRRERHADDDHALGPLVTRPARAVDLRPVDE